LSALMKLPVILIGTHDSIGLGEDGPTHQPVEQLAGLRALPNLLVLRPADAAETVEAWKAAIERKDGPSVLVLTRQKLPVLDRAALGLAPATGLHQGGYVLLDCPGEPQAIVLATGSEVHVALAGVIALQRAGRRVRLVSLPSWELFEAAPREYRARVLPPAVHRRVAIEAGSSFGWSRYTGERGRVIGLDHFGASAPGERLFAEFGFTPEAVVQAVEELLGNEAKRD
jgi:transketolase